jgi:hypothetical protein
MGRRLQGRLVRVLALLLAVLALLVAARGLVRHNTWYLASDQYAFLTFAGDLQRGTVFHDDTAQHLASPYARPGVTLDARVQTYFWRDRALYSRYPPGFPGLLALAGLIGGEDAQHALNPALYLTILALLGWLTWVLLRAGDRALAAGAAVAAMWLLLLLPTDVHLWGITVARDLPTHLLALVALLAAASGRAAASGLALGLACSVRPDAILYGVSLAALFAQGGLRLRPWIAAGTTFLVGAAPLFAYNTITQGHPLAFTQGTEFRDVLGVLLSPGTAWAADGIQHVSGGAFRVAHLWSTLPGNVAHLTRSLGWLGLATVLGACAAWRSRRLLAVALLPYPALALLFYSCWSHPDARYLAGVTLCLLPVTALGVVVPCRWLADAERAPSSRIVVALIAAAVIAASLQPAWARATGLGAMARAVAWALLAAALLPLVPRVGAALRRPLALAPALAFAVTALLVVLGPPGPRDPFQKERITSARATLGALIPPGSLVITSESMGRPAENISHYVGANAFYGGEFPLLLADRGSVVQRYLIADRRAFFLLRSEDRDTLRDTKRLDPTQIVARAHGEELYDWFVDPERAPFGAVLYEVMPSEETLRLRAARSDARATLQRLLDRVLKQP